VKYRDKVIAESLAVLIGVGIALYAGFVLLHAFAAGTP
jgi:hypothetical protein